MLSPENWNNRDRQSSNNFAAFGYIHTYADLCSRSTVCFRTIPLRVWHCAWLPHQHATDELSLNKIIWYYGTYTRREGVCVIHNSRNRVRYNCHLVCKREYRVRSKRVSRKMVETSGKYLSGSSWIMPPAVIQTLWFRHIGTPAHHGEDYLQWLIAVWTWRIIWTIRF
jgi:hypothetical protein